MSWAVLENHITEEYLQREKKLKNDNRIKQQSTKLSSNTVYMVSSTFSPLHLLYNILIFRQIQLKLFLRKEIFNKMCNTLCTVTSFIEHYPNINY